jgi:hypothetical protein
MGDPAADQAPRHSPSCSIEDAASSTYTVEVPLAKRDHRIQLKALNESLSNQNSFSVQRHKPETIEKGASEVFPVLRGSDMTDRSSAREFEKQKDSDQKEAPRRLNPCSWLQLITAPPRPEPIMSSGAMEH